MTGDLVAIITAVGILAAGFGSMANWRRTAKQSTQISAINRAVNDTGPDDDTLRVVVVRIDERVKAQGGVLIEHGKQITSMNENFITHLQQGKTSG